MAIIIIYLFAFLIGLVAFTIGILSGTLPLWVNHFQLLFLCSLCGGYGGILYCLRGIYLNYSVKKKWGSEWNPWYIIRPVASIITGAVSFLFLKMGLIVLEAKTGSGSTNIGYYALAFIAGLNVDKFINKIEDLAKAAWGIEKSRASQEDE